MLHLKTLRFQILLLLFVISHYSTAADKTTDWPLTIEGKSITATIYQPQPESLTGSLLKGRAAISIAKKGSTDLVFGALWFSCQLIIDRDSRKADLQDIKITDVKFPESVDATKTDQFKLFLTEALTKKNLIASYDKILASLEDVKQEQQAVEKFNNNPPEIIIAEKPTMLIYIDGEPVFKQIEGTKIRAVTNTPFFLVNDQSNGNYYLFGDQLWYSASDLNGKWKHISSPPKTVADIAKKAQESQKQNNQAAKQPASAKPAVEDIIVRTKPAELIVSTGKPDFATILGTNLLYMKNTESNVFMDIATQQYYILISGRWYKSAALTSGWTYVNADSLPKDFAKIPEGSEKDEVLASVPGTDAAKEAIMDAQIPQTAAVDRKSAKVDVKYDGNPKFEKVEGTDLQYAANSSTTVLKDEKKYYCVDNGVWYESSSSNGPWKVCDKRPEDVDKISPESPVYNVKYVYIYDSTPDVVYVGYTPGYTGCYVYGPTIVYGTGWYYQPWYGAYYYPRPVTWGFHMSYNPYWGWSMGFGVSVGWFNFSYNSFWGGGYYHGGWWGPPMYRPPYRPPYYGGGYYRPGAGYRPRPTPYNVSDNMYRNGHNNIYNNPRPGVQPSRPSAGTRPSTLPSGGTGAGTRPSTLPSTGAGVSTRPSTHPNNVYTDRNGNVYQKNNNGNWQTRDGNQWKDVGSGGPRVSQPSTNSTQRPQQNHVPQDVQRQSINRDRGVQRENSYNNYNRSVRPQGGSMNRGGGARPSRRF